MPFHPTYRSRRFSALATCLMVIVLLVWSHWLTPTRATRLARSAFETKWQGVADGCGFVGPGVRAVQRAALGYTISIDYACGMLPSDSPKFHQHADVYVSPLATVHQLP